MPAGPAGSLMNKEGFFPSGPEKSSDLHLSKESMGQMHAAKDALIPRSNPVSAGASLSYLYSHHPQQFPGCGYHLKPLTLSY